MKYIIIVWSLIVACLPIGSQAQNTPDLTATGVSGTSTTISLPTAYNQGVNTTPNLFNYSRVFEPQVPNVSAGVDENSAFFTVKMHTEYLDGLGRTIQTINRFENTNSNDLVNFFDHRASAINQYVFLPYSVAGGSKFQVSPFSAQKTYYDNSFPLEASTSFNVTKYQSNLLGRSTQVFTAGKSTAGQGRGQTTVPALNNTNEVIIWGINNTNQWPEKRGYYNFDKLEVKNTYGSDGSQVTEYTDQEGKLICKKILVATPVGAPSVYAYTYYVYDVFGGLRYTISPKAYEKLQANNWIPTNDIIENLTDYILYDKDSRIIEKHFASETGNTWYVYDDKNRVVLTQSPKLRELSKWTFTIYNKLDRPTTTGLLANTNNRQAWQQIIDNKTSGANTPSDLDYYIVFNNPGGYPSSLNSCEILTYTYYDSYDFSDPVLSTLQYDASIFNGRVINNTSIAVIPAVSYRTKGMVTATKTKLLKPTGTTVNGVSDWIYTVNYYDDRGRNIETVAKNYVSGKDILATQYDFRGRVLKNITYHENPSCTQKPSTIVDKKTAYYSPSFKLYQTQQKIDAESWKNISTYEYNELGQVRKKILGSVETQLLDYDIRGKLSGINKTYAEAGIQSANNDISFGESIKYDYGFAMPQYNGNVAGIVWKGAQSSPTRAYGYQYDRVGRLVQADFKEFSDPGNSGTNSWNTQNTDYTENNIQYDINGNVTGLKRMAPALVGSAVTPMQVDDLKMYYGSNDISNRVQYTDDNVAGLQLTDYDFKNGGTTTADYTYDNAGNLTYDDNKKATIIYNFLNRPEAINFQNGDYIKYVYDANGNKLIEMYSVGGQTYDLKYIGPFVYKSNGLYMINHNEGYSVLNSNKVFDYYFFIKDHLGNVRNIVQAIEAPLTQSYLASHEIASASLENAVFDNINNVRDDKPGSTDPADTKAARLDANDPNKRIGTALLLKVMAGDKFSVSTDTYFEGVTSGDHNVTADDMLQSIINTLIAGQGGFEGGMESGTAAEYVQRMFTPDNYVSAYNDIIAQNTDPTLPKAYLNYILFDENFRIVKEQSSAIQVNGTPGVWGSIGTPAPITIGRNGYLGVYVSSADLSLTPFFDRINLIFYRGKLVEENHYYPYGLTVNLAANNPVQNRTLYLGNQLEKTNGLHWYDFHARQYDPQLGRFLSVDPLHEFHAPYIYSANNPVYFKDKMGLSSGSFGMDFAINQAWRGAGISGGGPLGFSMNAAARHEGEMAYQKMMGSLVVTAGTAVLVPGGLSGGEAAYVASEEAAANAASRGAAMKMGQEAARAELRGISSDLAISQATKVSTYGDMALSPATSTRGAGTVINATADISGNGAKVVVGEAAPSMNAHSMTSEYASMMGKNSMTMDAYKPASVVVDNFENASAVTSTHNSVSVGSTTTVGNTSTTASLSTTQTSINVGGVNNEMTTVIGRMDDLVKFNDNPFIDTWHKSGIYPENGRLVTWAENRAWLDERILRGDKFGIATDPSTLPPRLGGYIPGTPNGYFTTRELYYLEQKGVSIIPMY